MRVYLAGPMRGIPQFNAPAFRAVAEELRALGYEVVSPVELDVEDGVSLDTPTDEHWSMDQQGFIRRDIDALLDCDGVVMLRRWEQSYGARAEMAVARWASTPVMFHPCVPSRA